MTQSARPFDDSLGDASGVAPYDDLTLQAFLGGLDSFVIPESTISIGSPLAVGDSGVAGTVLVGAGKAVVSTALYENTAVASIALEAAANNRIDRIVLRLNQAAQTIKITVIKGTEAANPAPPNITIFDLALGWVYLAAGFNPAVTVINVVDIHDERRFLPTGEHENRSAPVNLMHNSEFLAYSLPAAGNVAPEGWRITAGAPTSVTGIAPLTNQPRGRSIRIQAAGANEGIQTQVRVGVGPFTLRGTVNITSGRASVVLGFGTSGVGEVKVFRRTGANTEFILRGYSNVQQDLNIYLYGDTGVCQFGQVLLSQGFMTGYYRHKHELIMLDTPLTDANWTATAKSTGSTLIDLGVDFGALFASTQSIRGVILRIRGNDSASGGGSDVAKIAVSLDGVTALSVLRLGRVPNDKIRETIAFAPVVGGLGVLFYLDVTATGAGTLDATVEIIGIIT